MAKGFTLYMAKAVLSGRGDDELLDLARTNPLAAVTRGFKWKIRTSFMLREMVPFSITSVLSILHRSPPDRLTALVLTVGQHDRVGQKARRGHRRAVFSATHAFLVSPIGLLLLFGWSVAFFYHLCSGIRHLVWDAGYGFEIRTAYHSGYAVVAMAVVLTVLAWLYVLFTRLALPIFGFSRRTRPRCVTNRCYGEYVISAAPETDVAGGSGGCNA